MSYQSFYNFAVGQSGESVSCQLGSMVPHFNSYFLLRQIWKLFTEMNTHWQSSACSV